MSTNQSSSFFGARELKVVLVGDASVGKTSILNRYITGSHGTNISPTLGASFTTKLVESEGENVKLQIWDTSGEERYRSMAPLYYRGANVVVLVYDLTSEQTFKDISDWIEQLKGHVNLSQTSIILVGNKVDLLPNEERAVTPEAAEEYAKTINAKYYDASAVTGVNVDDIFATVAQHKNAQNKKTETTKDLAPADEEKKKCC